MKPLIVMPAVKNVHVTREAIDSVINQDADIILCANGADEDIIALFEEFKAFSPRVTVWIEPVNIGVNPVWNKFIDYFIKSDYTHLGILSSDVIMQSQFLDVLRNRGDRNDMPIPTEVNKDVVRLPIDPNGLKGTTADAGLNGIFIWLNKKQAKWVYPIPDEIKLWYGDNWIHFICRLMNNPTVILENFRAFHGGSVTLKAMETTSALIESDRSYWPAIQQKIINRVIDLKNEQN